ncbi:MAG: histidine kinase [Bryobacteraceae bacterium]|nr:histidine kinase [Bryobacteraceae bacterium]
MTGDSSQKQNVEDLLRSESTRLLAGMLDRRDQEWRKVSRLLHDDVGQTLSAVGLQLDVLRLDFERQIPEIGHHVHEIQSLLAAAIERVRELNFELNPSVVERVGLECALNRLAERLRREFGIEVAVHYDGRVRVSPSVATALFRIAEQAALTAAEQAPSPQVQVTVRPRHRGVVLEVRDTGGDVRGGEPGSAAELSLRLMRHYAERSGLELVIHSTAGEGSVVRAGGGSGIVRERSRSATNGAT